MDEATKDVEESALEDEEEDEVDAVAAVEVEVRHPSLPVVELPETC